MPRRSKTRSHQGNLNSKHDPHSITRNPIKGSRPDANLLKNSVPFQETQEKIINMRQDPEVLTNFCKNAVKAWHKLNTVQKIVVIAVIGAAAGCSMYYVLQLLTHLSNQLPKVQSAVPYPSNRLTTAERQYANQRVNNITRIDSNYWDRLQNAQTPSDVPKASFERAIEKQITEIRQYESQLKKYFQNAIVTKTQLKAIEAPGTQMLVTHSKGVGNDAIAAYAGNIKTYFFAIQSGKVSHRQLVTSLMNEGHHAAIHTRNEELGCFSTKHIASEPYCDKGNWNLTLVPKLERALMLGMERVRALHKIDEAITLKQNLSEVENSFYQKSLTALMHYRPSLENQALARENFQANVEPKLRPKKFSSFTHIIRRTDLQSHYSLPLYCDMHMAILDKTASSVIIQYQFGNTLNQSNKIAALLTELHISQSIIQSGQGNYGTQKLNKGSQVAELASFIEVLPVAIKQTIFLEFCQYFSEYFQVDYCDYDDPAVYHLGQ